MDEANLLEWAGISLGKGETYRLYLSMKQLAQGLPSDTERLRFFGKMTTRSKPYFIVEGISTDEEEFDESKQEGKSGANKYSYWVTQSVESGLWVKLPNVTMAQVVAARQFKRFLTGDLNAPVPSYPPFPGTEKNLLRTQIACIAGATGISPDGFFELDEDGDAPAVKLAEAEALAERFPKPAGDLKDPEAWKHHETELNKIGRVLAMPEQLDENGEPIEPEEPVELTQPLDAVKPELWSFRISPGGAGVAEASLVVARSLQWPGAVAVAAGRRFLNVYIGNGVPYSPTQYSPPLPRTIQTEWTPAEEDPGMIEQADTRADPTPPAAEETEE